MMNVLSKCLWPSQWLCDSHSDFVYLNNSLYSFTMAVWPSQWHFVMVTMACMPSQWLFWLYNDCVSFTMILFLPSQWLCGPHQGFVFVCCKVILSAFHNYSVCPSQWLLCSHKDCVCPQNNCVTFIMTLFTLIMKYNSHNDFHVIIMILWFFIIFVPLQWLCAIKMTVWHSQWLFVLFTMTCKHLQWVVYFQSDFVRPWQWFYISFTMTVCSQNNLCTLKNDTVLPHNDSVLP